MELFFLSSVYKYHPTDDLFCCQQMDLLINPFIDDNGTSWTIVDGELEVMNIPTMIPGQDIRCQMSVTADGEIWRFDKNNSIASQYFFIEFACHFTVRGGIEVYGVTDENQLVRISLKKNTQVVIAEGVSHIIEAFDFLGEAEDIDPNLLEELGDYIGASHVLAIDDEGYWIIIPLLEELNQPIQRQDYVSTELLRIREDYVITREGAYYRNYLPDGMASLILVPGSKGTIDTASSYLTITDAYEESEEFKVEYFLDNSGFLYELDNNELTEIDNDDLKDLNEKNQWIELLPLLDAQLGLVNALGEVYLYISGEEPQLTDIPTGIFGTSSGGIKSALG